MDARLMAFESQGFFGICPVFPYYNDDDDDNNNNKVVV